MSEKEKNIYGLLVYNENNLNGPISEKIAESIEATEEDIEAAKKHFDELGWLYADLTCPQTTTVFTCKVAVDRDWWDEWILFQRQCKKEEKQIGLNNLIKRINRRLEKDGEKLHKSKGEKAIMDLGEYYIKDVRMNIIAHKYLETGDIEKLGKQLKVA